MEKEFAKDCLQPKISSEVIDEAITSLDKDGYYCLENAIDSSTISMFKEELDNQLETHGKRYFSLINQAKEEDSPFNILEKSKKFKSLKEQIVNKKFPERNISSSDNFNILRVVTGKGTMGQSLKFHFDSRILTALVPICIPDGNKTNSGDWVGMLNFRKLRSSALFNLALITFQSSIFISRVYC